MNRDDVVDLLSAITAYDNRNATQATVAAWSMAADIGRWTLEEALGAVHAHYAESTEFLMPGHVTERIRSDRQDAALRKRAALAAAPVDPQVAERIASIRQRMADDLGWDYQRPAALQVRCPHCGAAVNAPCTSASTGQPLRKSACHPSRAEAFARESA